MSAQWDLTHLLDGVPGVPGEPSAILDEAASATTRLEARRGAIGSFGAADLVGFMRELAYVKELVDRVRAYASLLLSEDLQNDESLALRQYIEDRAATLDARLAFFKVEWAHVPEEAADASLAEPDLAFCRNHLLRLRAERPYLLSPETERALAQKAGVGADAWAHLFDTLVTAIEPPDGSGTQTLDYALSRLSSADRDERAAAARAITTSVVPGAGARALVYETVVRDVFIEDRLRGREHWRARQNLLTEVTESSVQSLLGTVAERYDVVQRWYRLKAALLGIDRLAYYDRLAPLNLGSEPVGWPEARHTVLEAYAAFSPRMADCAQRFFDEGWINSAPGKHRSQGAFCEYTVPAVHPYVMVNWNGQPSDVLTLAHEIGHGVHGLLAAPRGVFHQHAPVVLAETAAVFGEILVLRHLERTAEDPRRQLEALATSIETAASIVFRQTALSLFEDRVHRTLRRRNAVSAADISEIWLASQGELFGASVELTYDYRDWWSFISHFVSVPGYLYSYVFAHLLGLSMYERYEMGDETLPKRLLELLAAGGSAPVPYLLHALDIDLEDGRLWNSGLDLIERQIGSVELLTAKAASHG